jgi:hypothetical protein
MEFFLAMRSTMAKEPTELFRCHGAVVVRGSSHHGLETHAVVIFGLDPRITLHPHLSQSRHFKTVRAVGDARVKPEHDVGRTSMTWSERQIAVTRTAARGD